MTQVRDEAPADVVGIRRVTELAFGGNAEAQLVEALRAASQATISLVAIVDDEVAGHILFSPATIESGARVNPAIGLAPLSVLPEHQRQGIGSQLAREGLRQCRQLGYELAIVLGHPAYYPRFGFQPAILRGIRCEYPGAEESFMVAELRAGALEGVTGLARYRREFALV